MRLRHGKKRRPRRRGAPTSAAGAAAAARNVFAAGLNDPLSFFLKTDVSGADGGNGNGWETSAASGGGVVVYTGNWFASYSTDGGRTFSPLDPWGDVTGIDGGHFADQHVIYIPSIDRFVWLRQTDNGADGHNRYRFAVASPDQIVASKGKVWNSWDATPATFNLGKDEWMDYPDLGYTSRYLVLTFNAVGPRLRPVMARFPLSAVAAGTNVPSTYVDTFAFGDGLKIAQPAAPEGVAWVGDHTDDSTLRACAWPDSTPFVGCSTAVISGFSQSYGSTVPHGGPDWLAESTKIARRTTGGTKRGDQLWFAWTAGRDSVFPQSHIEIAIFDVRKFTLANERYLWNPNYAFAYPALAANTRDEIGIAFAWGGGDNYVYADVGFLTGNRQFAVASLAGDGGGGHYMTLGTSHPDDDLFDAAIFNTQDPGIPPGNGIKQQTNYPLYVLFGRSSDRPSQSPQPAPAPFTSGQTGPPSVATGGANDVGTTGATVTATVNAGGSDTHWHFNYGKTSLYGSTTPERDAGSDFTTRKVSETLTGLSPNTTYHYQVVASNSNGAAAGTDATFTTQQQPSPPPGPAPELVISALNQSTFTVANQGTGDAGPFEVVVNQSNGSTPFSYPSGLAAGHSDTESFACVDGGVTATADPTNQVSESALDSASEPGGETDNTATFTGYTCIH